MSIVNETGAPARLMPQFDSSEHLLIGNGVVLRVSGDEAGLVAKDVPLPISSSLSLTYGQVVYLAGDFFNSPDPISDGATIAERQQRFSVGYASLADPGMVSQIQQINQIVTSREGPTFANGVYTGAVPSEYFKENFKDNENLEFTKITRGRYLSLLFVNWDHFGGHAVAAYIAGHAVALRSAAAAAALPAPQRIAALQTAYAQNAFADHFLTDLFSTGHLRTPRKQLHGLWFSKVGDKLSQYMHDEDCRIGLNVDNVAGQSWRAYGDNRYLDNGTIENKLMVRAAIQASADEIFDAYLTQTTPPEDGSTYNALSLVPTLRPDTHIDPGGNYPGLITGDAQKRRDPGYVLANTQYVSYMGPTFLTYLGAYYDPNPPSLGIIPPAPPAPVVTLVAAPGATPDLVAGNQVRYAVSSILMSADRSAFDYESNFGGWSDFVTYGQNFGAQLTLTPTPDLASVIYRQFQYPDGKRSLAQCVGISDAGAAAFTDTTTAGHRWDLGIFMHWPQGGAPNDVALDGSGQLYIGNQNMTTYTSDGQRRIRQRTDLPLSVVSPAQDCVWGLGPDGQVFVNTAQGLQRVVVDSASTKFVSVAGVNPTSAYAVDTNGGLWLYEAGVSTQIANAIKQVVYTGGPVYALDVVGKIWKYVPSAPTSWVQWPVDIAASYIASSYAGALWFITSDGGVARGLTDLGAYELTGLSGARSLTLGNAGNVWALTSDGNIWRFTGPDYRFSFVPVNDEAQNVSSG